MDWEPRELDRLRHHGPVMAQALLLWLVVYVGLFALAGFLIFIIRGFSGREWSYRSVLRASSSLAFVLSAVLWLAIVFTG